MSRKAWFITLALLCLMAVIPLIGSYAASKPQLEVYPARLNFWQVHSGQTGGRTLFIANNGSTDLHVHAVEGAGPFSVAFEQVVIPPFGTSPVFVLFDASKLGTTDALITIKSNDPLRPSLEIPVIAEAIEPPEYVPLQETTRLSYQEEGFSCGDGFVELNYAIELSPVGPFAGEAEMTLDIAGDIPEGAQLELSPKTLPLGLQELGQVTLKVPLGTPAKQYAFAVRGNVVGTRAAAFSVLSPLIILPGDIYARCPFRIKCVCPLGVPEPTSTTIGAPTIWQLPDPDTNTGDWVVPDEPKTKSIARVTATIYGPTVGECCKGAQFRFEMTVGSIVIKPSGNKGLIGLTHAMLIGGLIPGGPVKLSGSTNGEKTKVKKVVNLLHPKGTAVELSTMYGANLVARSKNRWFRRSSIPSAGFTSRYPAPSGLP
jgi:hypothetical protein